MCAIFVENDKTIVNTPLESVIALTARCILHAILPGIDIRLPAYRVALYTSLHVGRIAYETTIYFTGFHANHLVGG